MMSTSTLLRITALDACSLPLLKCTLHMHSTAESMMLAFDTHLKNLSAVHNARQARTSTSVAHTVLAR
jgi:hypothetical protein